MYIECCCETSMATLWTFSHSPPPQKKKVAVEILQLKTGYVMFLPLSISISPLQLVKQSTDAKGLVVPILVIFFIIALPIVFHVIAQFERHKTRSGQEKITLFRSAIVWILALVVYIVAAYAAIQCTQSKDLQSADLAVTVITKNNRTSTLCRQVGHANNTHFCFKTTVPWLTVLGDIHWSTVL